MSHHPKLGRLLVQERKKRNLGRRTAAAAAGVARTVLDNLEHGLIQTPNPKHLQALATYYELDLAELYAAAGYQPDGLTPLPAFTPYLRSRYHHLPPEARAELTDAFERIAAKHGYTGRGPSPGQDETD